jgi:hypothetical protein
MQTVHATSDMNMAENRVGPERIKSSYAWRTVRQLGGIIANGTDAAVEKVNPYECLYAAVTRQGTADGLPAGGWKPEQKLDRQEALRSYTIWGAYAMFKEDLQGSLEVGKYADFAVIDRDYMKIPEAEIKSITALQTVIGGKEVYKDAAYKEVVKAPKATEFTVAAVKDKAFTGKAIKPAPAVKYGNSKLKKGTDYTVTYKNNKKVGVATITVKGKGKYSGTTKATFKIVPKATTTKLTAGTKQLTATWTKVSGTTKYEVRYKAKGAKKWVTKTVAAKNATYVIAKLKAGKTYQVQVRSYKNVKVGKKTEPFYSAWSKTVSKKI